MNKSELNARNITQFNSWAKIYDWPIFKLGFKKSYETVKKNLPNLKGKKLLSIACGTATLEVDLARKFPQSKIFCVDQSEEMLKKAKLKSYGLRNISFVRGEANKLPFRDNSFDFVICLNAFHHFPDQTKSLKEVNRVLKTHGSFFYADQLKDGFTRTLSTFINDLFEKGVFHYNLLQLRNFFTQGNFAIKDIKRNLRGALVIAEKIN